MRRRAPSPPPAVPPAVRPPPGQPRFPLVDGLRAVAALAVLVTHTAFLSGFNGHGFAGAITARLDCGVALFFVISGFLLHRPFVASRLDGGPPTDARRIGRYLRRRALRILPAYWLALTILAIWPGLVGTFTGKWWAYYGLLADLSVTTIHGGLIVAWSLCVELQFYLLLPVYALLAQRLLRGRAVRTQVRAELVVLVGLAALSLWARMASFWDPSPDIVSSTIAGTFLWFSLGMGLAVLSARWHATDVAVRPAALRLVARRPGLPWLAAGALLVLVSHIGMPRVTIYDYDAGDWFFGHVLYGAIAVCFAAPAMLGVPGLGGLPERILAWRPVAWLGLISYGIFLWHEPLCEQLIGVQRWTSHGAFVLYTLAVAAVAITCAAASYYLVERPLLRFKEPGGGARPNGSRATARMRARAEPEASPAR